jgi:hypothetical protein
MKKLILSLFAVAAFGLSSAVVYAGNTFTDEVAFYLVEEEKTEVTANDLPAAVKEGWQKSDYKDEKVEKIFKVTGDQGEYIEFIVATTSGKIAVHFDMNGKLLREKAVS